MKTSLSSSQKSSLSSAILGAMNSKELHNQHIFTRCKYICNLLLRSVSLDQPLIYVYNYLGRKTQIQMFRIIAYIIHYRLGIDYNPSIYRELYGSDIVNTFHYMQKQLSNCYL